MAETSISSLDKMLTHQSFGVPSFCFCGESEVNGSCSPNRTEKVFFYYSRPNEIGLDFPIFREDDQGKSHEGDEKKMFLLELLKSLGIENPEGLAVNAIISLVRLVGLVLSGDEDVREKDTGEGNFSPLIFLESRPQIRRLLNLMQDPDIVELLLGNTFAGEKDRGARNADCIRLLICRIVPFVRGMQKSLGFFLSKERGDARTEEGKVGERPGKTGLDLWFWQRLNTEEKMFFFIPGTEEVVLQGKLCDDRFPACKY